MNHYKVETYKETKNKPLVVMQEQIKVLHRKVWKHPPCFKLKTILLTRMNKIVALLWGQPLESNPPIIKNKIKCQITKEGSIPKALGFAMEIPTVHCYYISFVQVAYKEYSHPCEAMWTMERIHPNERNQGMNRCNVPNISAFIRYSNSLKR